MTRIHDQTQATEDKHRRVTGLEPTNHQCPDTLVGEHGLVPDPKVRDGVPKAQDQASGEVMQLGRCASRNRTQMQLSLARSSVLGLEAP